MPPKATKETATVKKHSKKPVTPASASKAKKAGATTTFLPKNTKFESPLTKLEMYHTIAESTGLSRKQVTAVLDCMNEIIHAHLRPKAAGECRINGLLKLEVKQKAATKARKGINPFTGESITFKAKPARQTVKIKGLKKLKEMIK